VLRPSKPPAPSAPDVDADPLLAFASEVHDGRTGDVEASRGTDPGPRRLLWYVLAVAATAAAIAAVALIVRQSALPQFDWWPTSTAAPQPATLTVTTRPDGAQVAIDGEPRGVTPLTLSISPGAHTLTVRSGSQERVLPLTAVAGGDIVRDLELGGAAPVAAMGALSVVTDPPGARVTVDGQPSGTSPVTVPALPAGDHTIAVAATTGSARRTVTVAAGQTASVVFSLPQLPGPVAGWLAVSVPFDVQILEGDEAIGASGGARIMLAAGRHDLVLVNQGLEYREARRVEIRPGQTTALSIEPPTVTVNVNARPWADVAVDGRELGQTPISNASLTVGTHQFVFRHPQFGERRQTVVVTSKGSQRIAVDLTR
jgi:hypothetical protein